MLKQMLLALTLVTASLSGSIIKIPPAAQEEMTYDKLLCSKDHKDYIEELITAMKEQSWLTLFKNRKHLEFIGSQINPVHPLKFLGTIFSNPTLKSYMPVIFEDFLKKGQLLDGLSANLNREADKGALNRYLTPFAQEVGVSPEIIQPYFQSRNWEGLVQMLNQS